MMNLLQFNTEILSIGKPVQISGKSQDLWYFEHNRVIKAMNASEIIVTYQDRLTKQAVDYLISIHDVIKGHTSIVKLSS